jgi:flagellar biosynthesis protein FliR
MASLSDWLESAILLGLRIAPVFAFAPPFTLVPMPALFRLLFGLGLSVALVSSHHTVPGITGIGAVAAAGAREFGIGLTVVLALQITFGALHVAGRTIDIQAGYGLATLIDPVSQSQRPLTGTLFALGAAAAFFALGGHIELLRFFSRSLDAIPLGTWSMPHSLERLTAFITLSFVAAFGVAGAAILTLFLIDMCIAMLSRTVPQMNVLVFGFQIKTLVLFLVLPVCFGTGAALLFRMMEAALDALPRLL